MPLLHYLIHGTWLGILALILFLLGLTLFSFAQISIHQNSSFAGGDGGNLSHRVVGGAFMLAGILVIALTIFFGNRMISSTEFSKLFKDMNELPQIKPIFQGYIATHPNLTQIDYHNMQYQYETLKRQLYKQRIAEL